MLFRSDRKSTRLNSSHTLISYAVFCLKKKKNTLTSKLQGLCLLWLQRADMDTHTCLLLVFSCFTDRHPPVLHSFSLLFFFFFKDTGPPGILPFSPPRPLPN